MVVLGALWIVLTTSGPPGSTLLALGGGHGIHLSDVALLSMAGTAALVLSSALRRLLEPKGKPSSPGRESRIGWRPRD